MKNKFPHNKKYFTVSVYAFIVILLAIIADNILDNAGFITSTAYTIFNTVKKLLSPFLIGFCIAYLFNPMVSFFERTFMANIKLFEKKARLRRTASILTTYIIVIGLMVWLMTYFIPELLSSMTTFATSVPNNLNSLEINITKFFDTISFINSQDVADLISKVAEPILNVSKNIPRMLQTILNSTYIAASTTINVIMGIFISFYMISEKESFSEGIKKVLFVLFKKESVDKFIYQVNRVNNIFEGFIVGKTIDSFIIGCICFVGMLIIKAPYAIIISVIIGITNMIPYFGPFIGAIPAVLIVFLTSPKMAIVVALFILALQQFDGIILGPKILGKSTDLSPIFIILSIVIGGAVMGPLGMFVGVPIFAAAKMFFNEAIQKRYDEKYGIVPSGDLTDDEHKTNEDK